MQAWYDGNQCFFTVVDAAGKIGSGILDGNIGWVGSYDECLDVTATKANQNNVTEVMFTGQYCVTTIGLSASSRGGGAFGMVSGFMFYLAPKLNQYNPEGILMQDFSMAGGIYWYS